MKRIPPLNKLPQKRQILLILLAFALSTTASAGILINPFVFKHPTPTPAPDSTPPTLLSATVDASGWTLTLVFDEPVTATDWSKADLPLTDYETEYHSGDAENTVVYVIVNGPVQPTDIEFLSYGGAGNVQDMAGNLLVPFTDFPVTNEEK